MNITATLNRRRPALFAGLAIAAVGATFLTPALVGAGATPAAANAGVGCTLRLSTISIEKVDAADGSPLEGATFEVTAALPQHTVPGTGNSMLAEYEAASAAYQAAREAYTAARDAAQEAGVDPDEWAAGEGAELLEARSAASNEWALVLGEANSKGSVGTLTVTTDESGMATVEVIDYAACAFATPSPFPDGSINRIFPAPDPVVTEIAAPEGYVLDPSPHTVEVGGTVTVENSRVPETEDPAPAPETPDTPAPAPEAPAPTVPKLTATR